jgi:hypothetical protein
MGDLLAYIAKVAQNRHDGRAPGNTTRSDVKSLDETLPPINLPPVKPSEALRSLLQLRPSETRLRVRPPLGRSVGPLLAANSQIT